MLMRPQTLVALMLSALSTAATGTRAQDAPERPAAPRVEPKPADGDAPLPVGFPDGTKPGVIEIKAYPAYRSAVAKGQGMSMGSGNMLFWALFQHIQRNDVAMTAPVINTYPDEAMIENPRARGEVSMEFLYQRPDQGKTGPDGRLVEVVDHPAGQYLCLGVQGNMSDRDMRDGLAKLKTWLDEHKDEWVAAGPPRRLGYHGPGTPAARKLWEVQLPIKPASEASAPVDAATASK